MGNLVRSEWIKFRSVRSTVITLALAGALVVLVAILVAVNTDSDATSYRCDSSPEATSSTRTNGFCPDGGTPVETPSYTHLTVLTGGVSAAALLFGVLGVLVIGQEYRFNTIRPTFTAVPQRTKVMVAKLIVVTLACAAVSVVMIAFCYLVGTTMAENFQVDDVDRRAALGIVIFSMGWSALGVAVGAILRQPIAAILVLLGEAFVAESILGALFESTLKWLPFSNGFQMTLRPGEGTGDELMTVTGGGIYFFAVVAVFLAVGIALVNRRDA